MVQCDVAWQSLLFGKAKKYNFSVQVIDIDGNKSRLLAAVLSQIINQTSWMIYLSEKTETTEPYHHHWLLHISSRKCNDKSHHKKLDLLKPPYGLGPCKTVIGEISSLYAIWRHKNDLNLHTDIPLFGNIWGPTPPLWQNLGQKPPRQNWMVKIFAMSPWIKFRISIGRELNKVSYQHQLAILWLGGT